MGRIQSSTLNKVIAGLAVVAGLGVLAYTYFRPVDSSGDAGELFLQAKRALQQQGFAQAEQLAWQAYQLDNRRDDALIVAGSAASKQGKLTDALRYYQLVHQDGDDQAITALWAAGELLRRTGRLAEAETKFREVLQAAPNHVIGNRVLANLLSLTGRRWEAREYLVRLIKQRSCELKELILLGDSHIPVDDRKLLHESVEVSPQQPLAHLGLAHLALFDGDLESAKTEASQVINAGGRELEAHLVLGKIYLEEGFPKGIRTWYQQLPTNWQTHPEAWFIIGAYFENAERYRVAIRCYWEVLKRDTNHAPATSRISRLLQVEQHPRVDAYLNRSQKLSELSTTTSRIEQNGASFERVTRVIRLMESMGRVWEAEAWYHVGFKHHQRKMQAPEIMNRFQANQSLLMRNPPLVLADKNPAHLVELSEFPLPDWGDPVTLVTGNPATATKVGEVRLRDIAQQVGLDFEYFNGVTWNQMDQVRDYFIFHVTGGGVGVLDYDLDGWPDIYVAQGTRHPKTSGGQQPGDRLFRNLGNGRFEDVTEQARLGDQRFSQGVSCGDFDNDGFPDLYVCNFGRDRLYQNQGDGTFRDITDVAGLHIPSWSTSAAIVDLNGDRLPDLYVSSYVEGDLVFEPCHDEDRKPRSCHPRKLPAASDHVYINQGDGHFRELTNRLGFYVPAGRGLGVVVGHLENRRQPVVFVANDTTENFYFEPTNPTSASFQEVATLKGVATDKDGVMQACMGIAVDDVDGDGRLDIYVTNFYRESNTFYHQIDTGLFIDEASKFGLRQSSLPMLGFGTQFFDSNLDGWPDLFVANGHIDDLSHQGQEFRMRPQMLLNTGKRYFQELAPQQVGDYFADRYLGRAVALIDWDRNGKQDVVVQHLDRPLALLANESPTENHHWVSLKLTGTESCRDAFGAIVEIELANRTLSKHLLAGSGYYASNERLISTGLGTENHIKQITVRWPSGKVDRWSDIPADQAYHLVEGFQNVIPIDRSSEPR